MSTIQQTVDKAGYELGYIEYGAALDATDAADAMNVLNEMMAEWEEQDMNFNWFVQDALGDTLPIPNWAERCVILNLAMALSSRFNVAPSQALFTNADKSLTAVSTRLINEKLRKANMNHLPYGRGGSRYDIDTDSF